MPDLNLIIKPTRVIGYADEFAISFFSITGADIRRVISSGCL